MSTHPVELSARRYSVTTGDGVELSVREWGPRHAGTTLVLLHGHTLRAESWGFVRRDLVGANADLRVVAYDHRGHGGSGEGDCATYTIDQLARDLRTVLDVAAPTGSVVLAGHSMGAMTILRFASQFPRDIGSRISGIALVAGAAGGLTATPVGRLLKHPLVAAVRRLALRAPRVMTNVKSVAGWAVARCSHASVSPQMKSVTSALQNETPIRTLAGFLGSFATFDAGDALPILGAVPTVVIYGAQDHLTPPELSLSMAARIPGAQTVRVENAGHSVIVEKPRSVSLALQDLVRSWAPDVPITVAA